MFECRRRGKRIGELQCMAMKMRFDQRHSTRRDSFGYGQDNCLALTKVGLERFEFGADAGMSQFRQLC